MAKPRAQTLRFQGFANAIVRILLHVPGLAAVVGRRLVTLYLVGHKTGRHYTIPVAYTAYAGSLLIGTPFAWKHNLHDGEAVQILLKGRRRTADVRAYATEPDVAEWYGRMAADNAQFARFNRIRVENGMPNSEDIHLAWEGGARAYLLTPR